MHKILGLFITLLLMLPVTSDALVAQPTTDDTPDGTSSYFCPNLTQTLKRGMRDAQTGGQVTELQNFLADFFDLDETTAVSGFFGRTTQKYLVQFQSQHGLPAFGIAGTLTRAKIAEVCKGGGAVTPGPICPAIGFVACPEGTVDVSQRISGQCPQKPVCKPVGVSCPEYQRPLCANGESAVSGERLSNGCYGAPYCKKPTPNQCPIYSRPLCPGGEVVSGGTGADGCELAPKCVNQNVIGVSIDPYVQADRQVGDVVQWSVKVLNAQRGSTLVTTLESADWMNRHYAFPGDGASRQVAGSSVVQYSAKILSQPGYDILPGKYKIHARLLAPADGSGKDSATHSEAETQIFSVGSGTSTKCGVNTFSVRGNQCGTQTFNASGAAASLAIIAPGPVEASYTNAYFQCYDGYSETMGVESSCKPVSVWQKYAQEKCANRCAPVGPLIINDFRSSLAPAQQQVASPYEAFIWVVNSLGSMAK